jgi:F0F1-type ATP synthase assembly protein I
MARKNDSRSLARSIKAFQSNLTRAQPAMAASYALVGAILLCGGLGYALDAWSGRRPMFLLGGLVLGIVVGLYQLARTLWHR